MSGYDKFEGDSSIDPSDLRDLLDEAKAERDDMVEEAEDAEHPMEKADLWREVAAWDEENKADVKRLAEFVEEIGTEDQLIRDDKMDDHLQGELEDCGDIPRNLPSYIVIDWDATCSNLKQDYSSYEYGEVTYWQRSS